VVLQNHSTSKNTHSGEKWKFLNTPDVSKRVKIFYAKSYWPFELLIGGKSMNIAFAGGTEAPAYEMAIEINDESFVRKANEWFLEMIRRETTEDSSLTQSTMSEAK
jgi:hypothetical protein